MAKQKKAAKGKKKESAKAAPMDKVCQMCGSSNVRENEETLELICMDCGAVIEPEE